jgi:hypothetical protein
MNREIDYKERMADKIVSLRSKIVRLRITIKEKVLSADILMMARQIRECELQIDVLQELIF